jgi:hypothetical protein
LKQHLHEHVSDREMPLAGRTYDVRSGGRVRVILADLSLPRRRVQREPDAPLPGWAWALPGHWPRKLGRPHTQPQAWVYTRRANGLASNFAPGVCDELQEKPDDPDEPASTRARRFIETGP